MSKVYFSIGSNKGNRSGLINEAINKIDIAIGNVELKSSVYESKSWGFNSNNFYNICLLIHSNLSPELILNKYSPTNEDEDGGSLTGRTLTLKSILILSTPPSSVPPLSVTKTLIWDSPNISSFGDNISL